jgi:serine/threonine-protein kinase HipA
MAPRRLLVVLYGEVIGRIDERSPLAEPEFTYDQDYVHAGSTPLGVRMPVADTTYRGRSVRAFLEGLLPESRSTRSRWGSRLGVDPDDAVGLLAHMGWDCPGAVQFCAPDTLDDIRIRARQLTPVDETHIAERLRSLRTQDEPSWTLPDEHWSLAGQQSKLALTWQPSGWQESHGSAATTHILKPGIGRLHHQALVEHATMRAASALGLDVAHTEFAHFADEPAIVIERYDRLRIDDGSILRIHQEDFCSASGRLPARKYEEHGGPGLPDMARIIEQNVRHREPAMAALGDFAAINYIAGAPDGHAKNISLLLLPGEAKLAPLYDLASGYPYDAADLDLTGVAVSIGGRRKFGQVLGKHWDRAAATLRIPAAQFRDRVRTLAEGFPDAFSDALRAVETPDATAIRQRTATRIATHIEQLIKRLDDPPEPTNTRRRAHSRTRPERPSRPDRH